MDSEIEMSVIETLEHGPDRLAVVVRLLEGNLHEGDRLTYLRDAAERPVDLLVEEIWRFAGLRMDALDTGHTAKVVLSGDVGPTPEPETRLGFRAG